MTGRVLSYHADDGRWLVRKRFLMTWAVVVAGIALIIIVKNLSGFREPPLKVPPKAAMQLRGIEVYRQRVREAEELRKTDVGQAILFLQGAIADARAVGIVPAGVPWPSEGESLLLDLYTHTPPTGDQAERDEFFAYMRRTYPGTRSLKAMKPSDETGTGDETRR